MKLSQRDTDHLEGVVHRSADGQLSVEIWDRSTQAQLLLDSIDLMSLADRQRVASQAPEAHRVDTLALLQVLATDVSRTEAAVPQALRPSEIPTESTEIGTASRFAVEAAPRCRYAYDWGAWLLYDGTRWARDTRGQIAERVKAFVRDDLNRAATARGHVEAGSRQERAAKAWHDHVIRCQTERGIGSIERLARSEPGMPIDVSDLDADPYLLNCRNGTVDLRTGQLWPHDARDLLHKRIDIDYDDGAPCPRWDRFLDVVTDHNPRVVDYLQRCMGYSLSGQTSEQVVFFLHGGGANGKSTFLRLACAVLGEYAVHTDPSTFLQRRRSAIRDDLVRLHGARIVSCAEFDRGEQLSEALVKQVTGGEPIVARPLYGRLAEFQPQFKLWMSSNYRPPIQGTDHGIWRRLRLIPFNVTIPEADRDRHLDEKLLGELPGILAWAVRGYQAYQEHGLADPQEVRQATSQYKEDEDPVAEFLTVATVDAGEEEVLHRDVFALHHQWSAENRSPQLGTRELADQLKQHGWKEKRTNRGKTWVGKRLRCA